eukprot:gene33927-38345_t
MKNALLIAAACLLALLSTIGASLPYPILPPLFASGAESGLNQFSGLPAVVREGDKFRAGFTLRNATAGDLKVALDAQVSGKALPRQSVAIAA